MISRRVRIVGHCRDAERRIFDRHSSCEYLRLEEIAVGDNLRQKYR